MDALKAGAAAGVFERLPLDAGPLLSLVCARSAGAAVPHPAHAPPHVSIFILPTAVLALEVDTDILPALRIWGRAGSAPPPSAGAARATVLLGYAYVFPDGVGRVYLRTAVLTDELRAAVVQLATPCTCAAGHQLLHAVHAGSPPACVCGSAVAWLDCDDASAVRACRTAFAEATTDQRRRLLSGARFGAALGGCD